MSVDISWDAITSGPDGDALAETIRDFIHAKFQQIALPKFINSVHVHSFDFGSVCPMIEIKDICDPLPDFYEDDGEDDDEDQEASGDLSPQLNLRDASTTSAVHSTNLREIDTTDLHIRVAALQNVERHTHTNVGTPSLHGSSALFHQQGLHSPAEALSGPFARSGTPGIPGGTSNMGYFHFPIGGLSGAQTPLAAVAGGGPFATQAWLNDQQSHRARVAGMHTGASNVDGQHEGNSTRPHTADSVSSPELGSPLHPSSPEKRPVGYFSAEKIGDDISSTGVLTGPIPPAEEKTSPSDLQVVARVLYNGNIRMVLTAEIMLDYPMPSFIKIPLQLSITGVAFDGVAVLAYIKRKMHFCFLDPEDADTLVGDSFPAEDSEPQKSTGKNSSLGSLLREIRVESEIGRQESGKQVLKNVSKVERFVLEQVRRIFEEEFVFPSFWTFLI